MSTPPFEPFEPSVDKQWASYRQKMGNAVTDPESIRMLRAAFYTGFTACFGIMGNLALNKTMEERNAASERITAELDEFFASYGFTNG